MERKQPRRGRLPASMLAIPALLLSVSAGLAQPAPPESVVAVPFDQPEDQGVQGDQGGFILLTWDAVEGADSYRIWREYLATTEIDDQGNLVELDTPVVALVPWGRIEQLPGESVVRAVVAELDGDPATRWAITTVQQTDGGTLESEPRYFQVRVEGVGTGVQARTWGDVKQQPRRDAR